MSEVTGVEPHPDERPAHGGPRPRTPLVGVAASRPDVAR